MEQRPLRAPPTPPTSVRKYGSYESVSSACRRGREAQLSVSYHRDQFDQANRRNITKYRELSWNTIRLTAGRRRPAISPKYHEISQKYHEISRVILEYHAPDGGSPEAAISPKYHDIRQSICISPSVQNTEYAKYDVNSCFHTIISHEMGGFIR